jgi:hypothetical protein
MEGGFSAARQPLPNDERLPSTTSYTTGYSVRDSTYSHNFYTKGIEASDGPGGFVTKRKS